MQFYLNGAEAELSDFMSDDLPRAVINSLFCWARARDDDDLPGTSKFGWWADTFKDEDDASFGSRLWLLQRSSLTNETLALAKDYAEEALQWLIDDGIAASVDVTASRDEQDRLDMIIVVSRPDRKEITARFADVWGGMQ